MIMSQPQHLQPDEHALYNLLPEGGVALGNGKLRETLGWDEARYSAAKEALLNSKLVATGRGRGGSLYRVGESDLELKSPEPEPLKEKKPKAAKRTKRGDDNEGDASILSYRHDQRRVNNPEVGMVSPESDPDDPKTTYTYDPHLDPSLQFDSSANRARIERLIDDALASKDENVMRAALEELRRLQAPYLQWTGKAERTSFEVDTVSLHVHERIDPASILSAVRKRMEDDKQGKGRQGDLFSAPFEQLPLREAIDFYKHDKGWSNRLVLGDSLLVMNSLLQKESMSGQVQLVFIDPPYGINYGSNFQPFTNKRNVKDRTDSDLTQEPEMIKAFRDTWELGIHSYLTYLRDRIKLSSELLHRSGSIFVQISDENLHIVRNLMDEVFGVENFVSIISFKKTLPLGSSGLPTITDYLIWYAKDAEEMKYNPLYEDKPKGTGTGYTWIEEKDGRRRKMTKAERTGDNEDLAGSAFFADNLLSSGYTDSCYYDIPFNGVLFREQKYSWKTNEQGMERLAKAGRIIAPASLPNYVRHYDDFSVQTLHNLWNDTHGASQPTYVVQTSEKVLQRILLLTTDPGDLVLDITCGSGTTAAVAEEWGRRWITCDTSRVALALAKQRLMTASFDYYALKYPHEGLKGGFIVSLRPTTSLSGALFC
jgi:adenine-specific DNA-methyltransferase